MLGTILGNNQNERDSTLDCSTLQVGEGPSKLLGCAGVSVVTKASAVQLLGCAGVGVVTKASAVQQR